VVAREVVRGGLDVDADDEVDPRFAADRLDEAAAEVPGNPGDEHDLSHWTVPFRLRRGDPPISGCTLSRCCCQAVSAGRFRRKKHRRPLRH